MDDTAIEGLNTKAVACPSSQSTAGGRIYNFVDMTSKPNPSHGRVHSQYKNWTCFSSQTGCCVFGKPFHAGCDCLQGFQLCHSLGGGTGAGMGTLLISKVGASGSAIRFNFKVFEAVAHILTPQAVNCQSRIRVCGLFWTSCSHEYPNSSGSRIVRNNKPHTHTHAHHILQVREEQLSCISNTDGIGPLKLSEGSSPPFPVGRGHQLKTLGPSH